MQQQHKVGDIHLTIPTDRNLLIVVRLTTAGVLARSPIGVDKLDDAKMAVEEACSCLMDQATPSGEIHLTFSITADDLCIRVFSSDKCPDPLSDQSMDPQETEIVRCLLEALADHVEISTCGSWIREIRMRLALAK